MESSGQGKSKVSDPSVKKEILYQCENKIRLMYKKRLSGLGAFIPEPAEEVVINNNSSPLIVHHPYLSYNLGSEKDIWNCPGIIIPPVKKMNSSKFVADSLEKPALIETLDSSKHRVKPHVSTTYSQFNTNVQVVGSNVTVSNVSYEQFNKNVQIVGSNETVSNIPHEQLLPSTYPVQQPYFPAWLGSYNQPTWQEIPMSHQNNYLLRYPLHLSQAKSQYFPEEIRNLTYPISATSLSHPFENNMYNRKGSTQSNITLLMGTESLKHSHQSNMVFEGKMPDKKNVMDSNLQRKSKRRRPRSRIPLSPKRRSKSPLPSRRTRSPLSPRRSKMSSSFRRESIGNHSPSKIEDTRKSDTNSVSSTKSPNKFRFKKKYPLTVTDKNSFNAPQTGDSAVHSIDLNDSDNETLKRNDDDQKRKFRRELWKPRITGKHFYSDETAESSVDDNVCFNECPNNFSKNNAIFYEVRVVSQNVDSVDLNVSSELSENETDNFSPPVIGFAYFCRLVGPEIKKLQVKSLFYEGIIAALEKGDQSCDRSYKLQDGALCKKFTKLKIIIPHDYLIDCILILHQNFHTATQKEICEFIKYYMYPAVHHMRKNVGRAFSECLQCKGTRQPTKCELISEGNAEKNQSKQTMKVIKLEKQIDCMIREQNVTDIGNMRNVDKKGNQFSFQNEIEEAEDSSLGRNPRECEKETKIKSEISERNNECWNNEKLNVSKNNTLLSATIELSSSTLKDEMKIVENRSQKSPMSTGENSGVEVVEKSSETQEKLAPNKPKGGSDFKTQVRALQLKCKESKERLVSLEAGEGSAEKYLLKGGMLCEKVRTADTIDIKIVAPSSEVDSIIGIVHTMSKTHTPKNKLIAFFLKHFTYIPELDEKVKKFVSACSICST